MTHIAIEREKLEQLISALKASKHGHLDHAWADEAIAIAHEALAAPVQEPVAWTAREIELIDGMIRVQLDHAERCDILANRTMADKQKGWDMERVALLQKLKGANT